MTTNSRADDDSPVLDLDGAIALMGGDRDDLYAVIDVFLEGVDAARDALAEADGSPPGSFLAACHELATSFGVVGARRGERMARGIESMLRRGQSVDVATAARRLAAELDIVVGRLRELGSA